MGRSVRRHSFMLAVNARFNADLFKTMEEPLFVVGRIRRHFINLQYSPAVIAFLGYYLHILPFWLPTPCNPHLRAVQTCFLSKLSGLLLAAYQATSVRVTEAIPILFKTNTNVRNRTDFDLYGYQPSHVLPIVFACIVAISMIIHIFQNL